MGFLSKILSRDESDEDVLQEAAALAVAEARVDESALDDDAAGGEGRESDRDSDAAEDEDPLADGGLDDDDDDLDLMDIFAEEVAEVDAELGELMEDIREVMGLWQDRVA